MDYYLRKRGYREGSTALVTFAAYIKNANVAHEVWDKGEGVGIKKPTR